MNTLGSGLNRAGAIFAATLLLGMMRLGVGTAFAQGTSSQQNVTPQQDVSSPDDADDPDDAATNAVSPDFLLPITVRGPWTGSISDDALGSGDFSITFKQHNYRLTGGWTATFNTSPEYIGNVRGTAGARVIKFRLASGQFRRFSCRLIFKSITASGSEIQGNYFWYGCGRQFAGDKGGSIDITPIPPE
jgi:hypothetical protein